MEAKKITESELEILNIIWGRGTATVREVHDILGKQKQSGYTTTLKLMQIMLEKGILKRKENERSHVYEAVVEKEKTQGSLLQKVIDNVFNGSAAELVIQALGNKKTSKEELDEIRKYLENLK